VGIVMITALILAAHGQGLRFEFGPCTVIEECPAILGVKARTWVSWCFLSATLVIKEALSAYGNTTYRYWITNEVMDRKATKPIQYSAVCVMAMVITWKLFQYVAAVVDVAVVVSGDLQYMLMLWAAETTVYIGATMRALKQRQLVARISDKDKLLNTSERDVEMV
jgi:hypothetical protein